MAIASIFNTSFYNVKGRVKEQNFVFIIKLLSPYDRQLSMFYVTLIETTNQKIYNKYTKLKRKQSKNTTIKNYLVPK